MKKTELEKLKIKGAEELTKDIAEAKEKLWSLRREIEGGKQKNVRSAKMVKRNIARMLTLIKQKAVTKK